MAVSKNAADDMMRVLSIYDTGVLPMSPPAPAEAAGEAYDVREMEEEEEAFAAAEDVIRRCNSSPSSSGMADYLYAVDDAMAAAALQGPLASRAAEVVQAAMPRLEEEARALLCSSSSSSRRHSFSYSDDLVDDAATPPDASPSPRLSPRAAASVRGVADRMLRAGYGPELAQVYVAVRRDALEEAVAHLTGAAEPVAIEEVLRMEWAALDQKMRRWNHAVRAVVRTLLAGERQLCDEVFASDEELGHECFADVARGCVLQLLGFADAAAMSARATEKLFRTIGMYEALADVAPELEALFAGDARELFAAEASAVSARLSSTVRRTIEDFGSAIQGESSRRPVQGGEIHPMTRYVLNYCGLLADCRGTLDIVLVDAIDSFDGGEPVNGSGATATPSGRCMRELMTRLLRKMDEKSCLYDDAGLKHIFLMNNLYYIVQKVMDSPVRELIGDDWIRRHRGQIRQYETGYLRASWIAVLACLRDDGGSAGPTTAKDKARSFNAAFEELYRNQTSWKVIDPQLREELRIAVSERLIPAYRSFLARPGPQKGSSSGRHSASRHIKYSLEDLEDYMLDFFEGVPKFVK